MTDTIQALSKRDLWKVTTIVTLTAEKNPKKKGSMSYERFQGYFTLVGECSVQDALDAGLRMDDIRHDSEHGYITLTEEADKAD